jgi:hypothetical protein
MADGLVYNLLERLAKALLPPRQELAPRPEQAPGETGAQPEAVVTQVPATPRDLAEASDVPEVIPFLGFRGGSVQQPGGTDFRMVYIDVGLQDWLLVEESGIQRYEDVEDRTVPGQRRQMLWVDVSAAVGRGHGPQSVEARFLTGDFTRAGDFEPPRGGGGGSSTGVFCEARTYTCCRYPSRG